MPFFIFRTDIIDELDWGDLGVNLRGRVQREVNRKVMRRWVDRLLPRHFNKSAKRKYRHQPRSTGYKRKKKRLAERGRAKGGGEIDNVLTGTFKELILGYSEIKPYPTRATYATYGPRYVTMRPDKSGQPWKWGETTTVTENEEKQLGQFLLDELVRDIEIAGKKKKRRTRV